MCTEEKVLECTMRIKEKVQVCTTCTEEKELDFTICTKGKVLECTACTEEKFIVARTMRSVL